MTGAFLIAAAVLCGGIAWSMLAAARRCGAPANAADVEARAWTMAEARVAERAARRRRGRHGFAHFG